MWHLNGAGIYKLHTQRPLIDIHHLSTAFSMASLPYLPECTVTVQLSGGRLESRPQMNATLE